MVKIGGACGELDPCRTAFPIRTRVGSGRVGSGGFFISRVGTGFTLTRPDP